jgi:hypothetical protein
MTDLFLFEMAASFIAGALFNRYFAPLLVNAYRAAVRGSSGG